MKCNRWLASGLIAALASVALAQDVVRYDNHKIVEITANTWGDHLRLERLGLELWSCQHALGPTHYQVAPEHMAALEATGLPFRVLVDNLQNLAEESLANRPSRGTSWFDSYHDYAGINAYIDTLVALRPDLATKVTVGVSLQGRTIYGIRLTGPGGGGGKNGVLFNGCQHAREWVAPTVPLYVADQLIRNYNGNPQYQALLDAIVIYLIPLSNPDGYVYSWNTDRLWRKNRRNNGDGTFGVDLNRNWAVGWGGEGSSGDTDSLTYRGTAPFSEPETQALRDFVIAHPEIQAHIDFHSFSQLVLSPFGYNTSEPGEPDRTTFNVLNSQIQAAIFSAYGEFYTAGPAGATLYLAAGTMPDWTYGNRDVLGWTIELRDTGDFGFELPADQILPTAEENLAGVLALADYVADLVTITYPSGQPTEVPPGVTTVIDVNIQGAIQTRTGALYSRLGASGPFSAFPLTAVGGSAYEATLPAAPCGAPIEYYIQVINASSAVVVDPPGAPTSRYSTNVGVATVVLSDNFQSNLGWTVQNTALTDGAWDRGTPAGAGDRGDPTADFDGSGACYLTDNVAGNSDVDGGPTRLLSPLLDLSAAGEYSIGYARWFSNDDTDIDRLLVEVSNNNGGSWALVESVPDTVGWVERAFQVDDYVAPTAQVRVRFSATDNPNDSVTEAAIDSFSVSRLNCDAPPDCPGDLNGDFVRDLEDLSILLANYGVPSGADAEDGDFNGDGDVDLEDLSSILAVFGTLCP